MTQRIRLAVILPLLLVISLLSACGFQLRGKMDIASEVSQLAVAGNDRIFVRDLTRALSNNGIQVTDLAAYRLRVLSVNQETGNQSSSSSGNYERLITLKVTYQLETHDGLLLFAPVELTNERYINQNPNQSNAAQSEIDINFKELRQDMIYNTVRRTASIPGAKLEAETHRVREVRRIELERAAELEQ